MVVVRLWNSGPCEHFDHDVVSHLETAVSTMFVCLVNAFLGNGGGRVSNISPGVTEDWRDSLRVLILVSSRSTSGCNPSSGSRVKVRIDGHLDCVECETPVASTFKFNFYQ